MKIGFLNLLTLILVIFKLAHMIDYSWWLVFTPTFVCIGLWILFIIFAAIAEFNKPTPRF